MSASKAGIIWIFPESESFISVASQKCVLINSPQIADDSLAFFTYDTRNNRMKKYFEEINNKCVDVSGVQ